MPRNNKESSKMNVCYVVMSFPRPSETFIAEEAMSLYEHQIEPHILSVYEGDSSIIHESSRNLIGAGNITYIKPESKKKILSSLLKLFLAQPINTLKGLKNAINSPTDRWLYFQMVPYANYLLENHICHLHVHFADQNIVYAKTLSDWTGVPFSITTHRYDIIDDPLPINVLRPILQKATSIITISQYNKELMTTKYDISPKKINIVHCGIRMDYFQPVKHSSTHSQIINLVNVGRLVPVKGQKYLLHALKKLKNKNFNYKLRIIGEGVLYQELKALIDKYELSDSVQLLGSLAQREVINELDKADIFIMPSLSEGIPVACMEAMAMKLPVVGTRITGLAELVTHKETGLLVPPENECELASAIEWLASHPDEREIIGDNARKKIQNEFERLTCTKRLLEHWNLSSKL